MKFKKPAFWDYKSPNFLSYVLLPLTIFILINNFFINKSRPKERKIKSICVSNIYIGGTGKTPLTLEISKTLNDLNYKTVIVKKFYKNQIDEQRLISKKTKLLCFKKRKEALDDAIKKNIDVAIFDDGLQDRSIKYDLSLVCFNNLKWVGNGLLIPAGPLREKLSSILKYDGIFLSGNIENTLKIKKDIKRINPNIKIFEAYYRPINLDKFNLKNKYLIFSGIGNPDSFRKMLFKYRFNIIDELRFPDHHVYTKKDIYKIKLYAKKLGAKILTTEKDHIKLDKNSSKDINFLKIDMIIKEKKKLINFIKSKI